MHAWEQIQCAVDYIEDHLGEPFSVEPLAKLASLSPFYFQRLFCRLVGKPVLEYIRLRRMAVATKLLLEPEKRILDIALALGFSSHEHFTRTFKDTFGMTPDAYRKNPQALNCMTKPALLLRYALVDEGVPLVADGIVLEINRKALSSPIPYVGFEATLPVEALGGFGTESGVDPLDALWRAFHSQKSEALGLSEDAEELGTLYASPEPGMCAYFAGGRADADAQVPAEAKLWSLPAGEYVVCSFEAENFEALVMDALYKAQQYTYRVWLPNHKLQTAPFSAERYARHTQDTTGMELWLKLV